MKSRSRRLAEHSINSALSAIEIYNKPDFKDREQIFCVLMAVAWESLLKSRLVSQNRNKLNCLYVKESSGRYKRNRNNQPHTIDIYEALRRCSVNRTAEANIKRLVEIRDAVVHLTADSPALPYVVFTIGTASLRNYAKLVKEWFKMSLAEYHFYILPLAFDTPFETLRTVDLQREPSEIQSLIEAISTDQNNFRESAGYSFVCEIEMKLISAKKITESTDLVAAVSSDGTGAKIVQRTVSPLDKYPLSANELNSKVREDVSGVTKGMVWNAIKELDLKTDSRYSKYSYRTHKDEEAGPAKASGSIYNLDCVKVLVQHFKSKATK